jgi:hypothetical protein
MDSGLKGSSPAEITTSVMTGAFGFSGQQIAKRLPCAVRRSERWRIMRSPDRRFLAECKFLA